MSLSKVRPYYKKKFILQPHLYKLYKRPFAEELLKRGQKYLQAIGTNIEGSQVASIL